MMGFRLAWGFFIEGERERGEWEKGRDGHHCRFDVRAVHCCINPQTITIYSILLLGAL